MRVKVVAEQGGGRGEERKREEAGAQRRVLNPERDQHVHTNERTKYQSSMKLHTEVVSSWSKVAVVSESFFPDSWNPNSLFPSSLFILARQEFQKASSLPSRLAQKALKSAKTLSGNTSRSPVWADRQRRDNRKFQAQKKPILCVNGKKKETSVSECEKLCLWL